MNKWVAIFAIVALFTVLFVRSNITIGDRLDSNAIANRVSALEEKVTEQEKLINDVIFYGLVEEAKDDWGYRLKHKKKHGQMILVPHEMKLTAYSNDSVSVNVKKFQDGKTATMTTARYGVVAADWSVFPPGTWFYITGYGFAVVEDRGSAIKGKHLDLFMNTYEEAVAWGALTREVYEIQFVTGSRNKI